MTDDTVIQAMQSWRHHLHRNPEFGFDLPDTARFVVDTLRGLGVREIETGIGGSGVVATLRKGQGNRTIALRADMDCLQITEATGLPHASERPGLMHACGHDGHTAILLGTAARLIADDSWDGVVRLVFQPAEEWGQGMKAMIADGLGQHLAFDEIYGLHGMPGLPVGSFAIRPGPFMGAEDGFRITVTGTGGHASRPHETSDAIVCACALVGALQTVVSREIDPAALAVLSVTAIHADNVRNAIAGTAVIEGDCRHFDDAVSARIEAAMTRIASGVAAAHGCTVSVDYDRVFVPLVNDPTATAHAVAAANTVFGPDQVTAEASRVGASEDFAQALRFAPGAFGFIGNGDSAPLHNAGFDFNDAALEHGLNWFVALVHARLPAA